MQTTTSNMMTNAISSNHVLSWKTKKTGFFESPNRAASNPSEQTRFYSRKKRKNFPYQRTEESENLEENGTIFEGW